MLSSRRGKYCSVINTLALYSKVTRQFRMGAGKTDYGVLIAPIGPFCVVINWHNNIE